MWDEFKSNISFLNEGIISFEKPLTFNDKIKTEDFEGEIKINSKDLVSKLIHFVLENGFSGMGNSYLIQNKFILNNVFTCLTSNDNILGAGISVKNTLNLNGQKINSALTTYLTTSIKHRKVGIAEYIIKSLINHGYYIGTLTGYHFVLKPCNISNLQCSAYFYPLNVELAKEHGYQFKEYNYDTYVNFDYSLRTTIFDDFYSICGKVNRKLNIQLTESEFENISKDIMSQTILFKNKIVGLVMYKLVMVYIHKTKKFCPVARIVYFETLPKHSYHVLSSVINHLQSQNKYAVMSGVCLGELTDKSLTRDFVITKNLYLNFYNIYIEKDKCKAENVNVLYI